MCSLCYYFSVLISFGFVATYGRCAEIGDRKCHVVILRSEQTVEWDEEFPPGLGEQFAKGLFCILRFIIIIAVTE